MKLYKYNKKMALEKTREKENYYNISREGKPNT